MFPIALQVGSFAIHTYGVLVALGYLAGITYVLKQQRRIGLSEERLWTLIYVLFAGAIVGGKLAYALASWSAGEGFWTAFVHFRYGFVFYGGLLGTLAAGAFYVWRRRLSFWRTADPFAAALPLGHAIGRAGCFAAACCYGTPSSAPWAVRFTHPEALVPASLLGVPLHPVQLYEAAGNLAIFLGVHFRYFAPGARPAPAGRAFLVYVVSYAALRFAVEAFRADERGGFVAGLSPSQAVAAVLAAAAAALLWRQRGRRAAAPPEKARAVH